jgi:hypothetical protein
MKETLERFVTASRRNRFLPIWQIPRELGWDCSEEFVCEALKELGFNKRSARVKPFLNEQHQKARLEWVTDRLHWTTDDWRCMLWTDETAMQCLGQVHGKVTRRKGEEYEPDCVQYKFKKLSDCMFWASISGLKGRGKKWIFNFFFILLMLFRTVIALEKE